jgi:hypothetical protein
LIAEYCRANADAELFLKPTDEERLPAIGIPAEAALQLLEIEKNNLRFS